MAVKYVALLGDRCLPHAHLLFSVGHVPIDNLLLTQLKRHGLPEPKRFEPWSRIDNSQTYMQLQHWVRETFPSSTPLAVEFHLWQNAASHSLAT
jgi:hypothetical protein